MAQQTTDEQCFPRGTLITAIPVMMITEEKVFRHIPKRLLTPQEATRLIAGKAI